VLATLAGLALLAGCGVLPASEPSRNELMPERPAGRAVASGPLAGLFSRRPAETPDAVAVSTLRLATVERAAGGVILRVTGVAPTQGYFGPALVPQGPPDAAGLLTVAFLAIPPIEPQQVGPERTRLLLAAAYASDLELRGLRGFRLVSGPNVQTLSLPPR
jgi:hypothetical protein